jgi:hypothetical protein
MKRAQTIVDSGILLKDEKTFNYEYDYEYS